MKHKYRGALAFLLALCMVLGFFPGGTITAGAAETITYVDENGNRMSISADNCSFFWDEQLKTYWNHTTLGNQGVTGTQWEVARVSRKKTQYPMKVYGDVNLIIADGVTLNFTAGLRFMGEGSLTIYGQENGTGTLITNGEGAIDGSNGYSSYPVYPAGMGYTIGYSDGSTDAEITINGGIIKATGKKQSPGIGGIKKVTINAGTVTATGGSGAAGIGSNMSPVNGDNAFRTEVIINGGKVTAIGGEYAAGIGGGQYDMGGKITINGGEVTAIGGTGAPGIGSGCNGRDSGMVADDRITITGGSVTAYGGESISYKNDAGKDVTACAPAIGIGAMSIPDDVNDENPAPEYKGVSITGGMVTASAKDHQAIDAKDVTINQEFAVRAGADAFSAAYTTPEKYAENNSGSFFAAGPGADLTVNSTVDGVSSTRNDFILVGETVAMAPRTDKGCYLIAPEGYRPVMDTLEVKSEDGANVNVKEKAFTMPQKQTTVNVEFEKIPPVAYVDANGQAASRAADAYTPLNGGQTTWDADASAWYAADCDAEMTERVTVKGDVNLILCDGAALTAPQGIRLTEGSSLTVYEQSGGVGALNATGGAGQAGIGGDSGEAGGAVTVYGGIVGAIGGSDAMGIGRGKGDKDNGTLTTAQSLTVYGGASGTDYETLENPAENRVRYMKIELPQEPAVSVPYLDENGQKKTAQASPVTRQTVWTEGWYSITGETSIGTRVLVTGDVHLIICDEAAFNAKAGITVADGGSLTVYSQAERTGTITAAGGENQPGIGGTGDIAIKIYNVAVTAQGGENAVGIEGPLTVSENLMVTGGDTPTAVNVLDAPYSAPRPRYMAVKKLVSTVFFQSTAGWQAPYCRSVDKNGADNGSGGKPMTWDGEYWRLTVDGRPVSLQFFETAQQTAQSDAVQVTAISSLSDGKPANPTAVGGFGSFFVIKGNGLLVTLIYDDGKTPTKCIRVEQGQTIETPADPMNVGYVLDHWERSGFKDGRFVADSYEFPAVVEESCILYAVFKQESHTVSIDTGYETPNVTTQTVAHYGKAIKPANPPRPNVYPVVDFRKWILEETVRSVDKNGYPLTLGKGTEYDFSTPVTCDVKLKAVFTHEHTFGSSPISQKSFGYNKAGHIFVCATCGAQELRRHTMRGGWCEQCGYNPNGVSYTVTIKEKQPSITYDAGQAKYLAGETARFRASGDRMLKFMGWRIRNGNNRYERVWHDSSIELVVNQDLILIRDFSQYASWYLLSKQLLTPDGPYWTKALDIGNFFAQLFSVEPEVPDEVSDEALEEYIAWLSKPELHLSASASADPALVNLQMDWTLPYGAKLLSAGIYTTTNREMQKISNSFWSNDEVLDTGNLLKADQSDDEYDTALQTELRARMLSGIGYYGLRETTIHEFSVQHLLANGSYTVSHELPDPDAAKGEYYGPWVYAMAYATYETYDEDGNAKQDTMYTNPVAVSRTDKEHETVSVDSEGNPS